MKKIMIVFIILISIIVTGSTGQEVKTPVQANNELIRLHVLANSDSEKDQIIKYQIKDAIIKEIGQNFRNSENINETREILVKDLGKIENVAQKTLKNLGINYDVKASYGNYSFPTKYYGNFSLPAGEYEAVKVVIGKGEGANWWCVLFPPLCFIETEKNSTDFNKTKNGYPINTPDRFKNKKIRVSFKIVEWVKDSFSTIAKLFN